MEISVGEVAKRSGVKVSALHFMNKRTDFELEKSRQSAPLPQRFAPCRGD